MAIVLAAVVAPHSIKKIIGILLKYQKLLNKIKNRNQIFK